MLLLLTACVEREFFIHTDPTAVHVSLDGQESGVSPIRVPFLYYGTRLVELRRPGYEVRRVYIEVETPWYQYFPLDLFFDLLWPFTLHDQQVFFLAMEPLDPEAPFDWDAIMKRADALRFKE